MKHETHFTEQVTWEVKQSGNEIWPVYAILQNKNFYQKNLGQIQPRNQFQTLFNFQRILDKGKSEEVCLLIWTNFDSLAAAYLI